MEDALTLTEALRTHGRCILVICNAGKEIWALDLGPPEGRHGDIAVDALGLQDLPGTPTFGCLHNSWATQMKACVTHVTHHMRGT